MANSIPKDITTRKIWVLAQLTRRLSEAGGSPHSGRRHGSCTVYSRGIRHSGHRHRRRRPPARRADPARDGFFTPWDDIGCTSNGTSP
ncbi:MAG: hypothetical protein ACUVSV_14665 [Armatimonadota bacterium]